MQATMSLRHTNRPGIRPARRPWTTYGLLFSIVLVLLIEIGLAVRGMDLAGFVRSYGLVSTRFSWADPLTYLPLVTFNFLHAGAKHFATNVIILLFAGVAVEKHAGCRATMLIWLAGGMLSGIAHLFIFPGSDQALIGASGAVSALLGAALVIGWHWALPIRLWRGRKTLFSISLPVVTGIWLSLQLFGFAHVLSGATGHTGVATWAHLTGFTFGMLCAVAMLMRSRQRAPHSLASPVSTTGD
jgi:membrane associated rhomboid family serine protease